MKTNSVGSEIPRDQLVCAFTAKNLPTAQGKINSIRERLESIEQQTHAVPVFCAVNNMRNFIHSYIRTPYKQDSLV